MILKSATTSAVSTTTPTGATTTPLATTTGVASITPAIPDIISVLPIRPEDLPQNINAYDFLACFVCGSMIDITDCREQHVVKCENCNEATVGYSLFRIEILKSSLICILKSIVLCSLFVFHRLVGNTFDVHVIVFLFATRPLAGFLVLELNGLI